MNIEKVLGATEILKDELGVDRFKILKLLQKKTKIGKEDYINLIIGTLEKELPNPNKLYNNTVNQIFESEEYLRKVKELYFNKLDSKFKVKFLKKISSVRTDYLGKFIGLSYTISIDYCEWLDLTLLFTSKDCPFFNNEEKIKFLDKIVGSYFYEGVDKLDFLKIAVFGSTISALKRTKEDFDLLLMITDRVLKTKKLTQSQFKEAMSHINNERYLADAYLNGGEKEKRLQYLKEIEKIIAETNDKLYCKYKIEE